MCASVQSHQISVLCAGRVTLSEVEGEKEGEEFGLTRRGGERESKACLPFGVIKSPFSAPYYRRSLLWVALGRVEGFSRLTDPDAGSRLIDRATTTSEEEDGRTGEWVGEGGREASGEVEIWLSKLSTSSGAFDSGRLETSEFMRGNREVYVGVDGGGS